jgi:competence protein ComEA
MSPSACGVLVCVAAWLSTLTPGQVQLPDAPGKDETVRVCGACHGADRAVSVRLNREGWQDTVAKMVDLGATGSDEELAKVVDYLAEHFKGEAPRPLNLNTATAVELESIVGLLRKESAAWIAHRKASGPCKGLDDLKNVAGVPFKKIDERRDRLVCF